MQSVVLIIHLMLATGIIGLVLIQRSEGGGLGIGGSGGGMGGLASAQTTGNILTKATGMCAAGFFVTSLVLGILAGTHTKTTSLIEEVSNEMPAITAPVDGDESAEVIMESLEKEAPSAPIAE